MTAQGAVDWRKLKRFALWFIPYILWIVAIIYMTAPIFGEQVGNTISFDGPHFIAWLIAVIALLRAVSVWIGHVVVEMLGARMLNTFVYTPHHVKRFLPHLLRQMPM
ncbi:MAG: hypothetical protein J7K48_03985 [Thermococcus sp.]|nr:hypothetical protein [Thermococcus sp.]